MGPRVSPWSQRQLGSTSDLIQIPEGTLLLQVALGTPFLARASQGGGPRDAVGTGLVPRGGGT